MPIAKQRQALIALSSVLLIGLASQSYSQGYWDTPVQLSNGTGYVVPPAVGRGKIAVAGGPIYPGATDSTWFMQSTDRGRHWTGGALSSAAPGFWGGGTFVIGLAYDARGAPWVLINSTGDPNAPPEFSFAKSTDSGKTFSYVKLGQGDFGSMFPRLAASSLGDMYIAWVPSNQVQLRLRLTRIQQGNEHQRSDTIFTLPTARVASFDLALAPSGLPICVWSGNGQADGGRQKSVLYYVRSSDSVHLLDTTVPLDSSQSGIEAPSVACGEEGRVYISYGKQTEPLGYGRFLVGGSLSGSAFTSPVRIAQASSYTPLCIDSVGGLNIMTSEGHLLSADGGQTFQQMPPSPGHVPSNLVAGPGGELYGTYGTQGAYFCRWHSGGAYTSWYPVQTGNFWNYQVDASPGTIYHRFYRQRTTVIGDTLMPNGLFYWQLDAADPLGGKYVRTDSVYVHYYVPLSGADERVLNFRASVGTVDTFHLSSLRSMRLTRIDTMIQFGRSTTVRHFHGDGLTMFNLMLADSFGIVVGEDLADGAFPYYRQSTMLGGACGGTQFGVLDQTRELMNNAGGFRLDQNYPNPFNPTTTIRYALPHRSHVTLTVFNTLGQKVVELVNGDVDAGTSEVRFDGGRLASGVYFYHLQTGTFVKTRTLLIVK